MPRDRGRADMQRVGPGASGMNKWGPFVLKAPPCVIFVHSEVAELHPLNNGWVPPECHPQSPPWVTRLNCSLVAKTHAMPFPFLTHHLVLIPAALPLHHVRPQCKSGAPKNALGFLGLKSYAPYSCACS